MEKRISTGVYAELVGAAAAAAARALLASIWALNMTPSTGSAASSSQFIRRRSQHSVLQQGNDLPRCSVLLALADAFLAAVVFHDTACSVLSAAVLAAYSSWALRSCSSLKQALHPGGSVNSW